MQTATRDRDLPAQRLNAKPLQAQASLLQEVKAQMREAAAWAQVTEHELNLLQSPRREIQFQAGEHFAPRGGQIRLPVRQGFAQTVN